MKTGRPGTRPVAANPGIFRRVAELFERRIPSVLVTVTEASGSAPGKAGSKLVVTADTIFGTVGGGRVENAAIAHARELLGRFLGPELTRIDVVQDLGMSCGGSMNLLYEPMTPPPRLVIFGAGHLSKPLCAMAALAGFDVTVCDEREEWLTAERFPDAKERILASWEVAVEQAGIDGQTFVASVSPGHAFDKRVVKTVVEKGLTPRYLGVIGSRRKGVLFRQELVAEGMNPKTVAALHIPMGLNIGAVDPREIAVAVVAELVAELRSGGEVASW